ncbi:hypothetical protein V491_07674 [Pseudogymnoascus sp. VKM F-3775]|nr:hypothetical protein V491_07674 [Pseudogymnoascus sp. VKM F-3775]
MADTNSSGRNNGRDGGRSDKHRGMRSGRHDGNQTSGQNVKRKIRRNHAPGENHEDETNGSPDEPNSDEERANPLSAAPLFSDRPTRRVFQPSSHIMPSFIQGRQGGEGYGVSEGGPGNGWSFAGQNEPIPGHRDLEGIFVYPHRISLMIPAPLTLSYDGQAEPIPGSEQPNSNSPVLGDQLVGLKELLQYSPFDTWESEVSRGENPVTDFFFDLNSNRGPPARNA